jgi:two-component system response regulator FixJ
MDSTVFVVDDDASAQSSLLFLLRAEGLRCRAFGSARAFLEILSPDYIGCIVTDIRMPDMDGIGLMERLREIGCRMPVVVITGHGDVPLAVQAMKSGAMDFIEKPFTSGAILTSVRNCLDMSHRIEARETERASILRRRARLTEREAQVMELLVVGRSNKEIGAALDISHRTVEIYRMNLMSKMHAESLAELVRMHMQVAPES